ncbi:MAG: APC family permease [Dechloromonas sp.]|uniref:APC family permease n=1 Tax=Dechloromonas sp. TaxID=1917218 RepID=UPI0027ECBB25|nr:APC family permease [Dechloromonas sp.]MBT9519995.1 APC family permease [Dechloromonas sp.]
MTKSAERVDAITADLSNDVLSQQASLHRKIDWKGAFWVASGVPALVLFSIGAIAATVGKPAWLVWGLSISLGFIQAFTYAEIAGLFPHKSGGISIYGAVAWSRYCKLIAPISVWCYWGAWSPILAIGSGLAAGYMLSAIPPPDSNIHTWKITVLDLEFIKYGLSLRINATFIVGCAVLLTVFGIQHGGLQRSTKITMILGITALIPLVLIGLTPLFTGNVSSSHLFPLAPLAYGTAGNVIDGNWTRSGWTLMAGGLFIAAWSTYGFESAVCYTREFINPKTDTFRAIFFSGLLCIVVFTLVPIAFQGYLGLGQMSTPPVINKAGVIITPAVYDGILAPDIYSGMGVAKIMAKMLGAGIWLQNLIIIMLIFALMLSIMTSMACSSRCLYQGSVDGFLPKYLSRINEHGVPTNAMWTDLIFNITLLMLSDYIFVIAASNVGYIIFTFLNLNAGWIHRLDRPHWNRPYKAPNILLALGSFLAFFNLALMGMGADIWGEGTLKAGLIFASLIIPIFIYRHFLKDKGIFPQSMLDDMHLGGDETGVTNQAGILPYLTILAGAGVVYLFHKLAAS